MIRIASSAIFNAYLFFIVQGYFIRLVLHTARIQDFKKFFCQFLIFSISINTNNQFRIKNTIDRFHF